MYYALYSGVITILMYKFMYYYHYDIIVLCITIHVFVL